MYHAAAQWSCPVSGAVVSRLVVTGYLCPGQPRRQILIYRGRKINALLGEIHVINGSYIVTIRLESFIQFLILYLKQSL